MASESEPPPRFLRDMVREIGARLSVARVTGQVDGLDDSIRALDAAWRCRRAELPTPDLADMKDEMAVVFAELKGLIAERASRHADVVLRPRAFYAEKRLVPLGHRAGEPETISIDGEVVRRPSSSTRSPVRRAHRSNPSRGCPAPVA